MNPSSRRPFVKPSHAEAQAKLKREWVSLEWGDVCVWGMTAAEMIALGQRASRPAIDPRGGMDQEAAAAWLVAFCTRRDDEPDSPRIWDDLSFAEVLELPGDAFAQLSAAAQRVNGQDSETIEERRDFTPAAEAPSTSGSPSSASNNSTGSPVSLITSRITS